MRVIGTEKHKKQQLDLLFSCVLRHFGRTRDEVLSNKTKRSNAWDDVYPRHLFSYLAYEFGIANNREVADYFDKNHATIVNSRKKVKALLSYDKYAQRDIQEITRSFNEVNAAIIEAVYRYMDDMDVYIKQELDKLHNEQKTNS